MSSWSAVWLPAGRMVSAPFLDEITVRGFVERRAPEIRWDDDVVMFGSVRVDGRLVAAGVLVEAGDGRVRFRFVDGDGGAVAEFKLLLSAADAARQVGRQWDGRSGCEGAVSLEDGYGASR